MLNETSFGKLTLPVLKVFCKNVLIKNYSKLKKHDLFDAYNRYLAVKVIQKWWRNHFYKNATDCITLEKVDFPCFVYRTKFGKHFFYSYDSIIKYIMKTGDCRDPNTRSVYTDLDLARLDAEAKHHFPNIRYSSTLKISKNINYAKRIRNRENEILSFQMRLDELRNCIVIIVESGIMNLSNEPILIENVEYRSFSSYVNTIIHELKLVYNNLKAYDEFSANIFKENILETLRTFSSTEQLIESISLF